MTSFNILRRVFGGAAMVAAVAVAGSAQAQIIIDDSFADGNASVTGMSMSDVEGSFFTSTNSNALEASVGSLGLVSGTSGRGIHATFATQSLNAVGDQLVFSYAFTTPTSIEGFDPANPTAFMGGESSSFRTGLFDASGIAGGVAAASTNFTSSTDPIWENLSGFLLDHDVNTGSEDLNFRERNGPGPGQDRLLGSTGDFSSIGSSSSPDGNYQFVPNTAYAGSITVTRLASELQLDATISGGPGVGGTTHSVTYTPTSFDFNLLAFHANSNNFGSTTALGDPDNGLEFSNVRLEFVPAAVAVPEPSSAMLLLGGIGALGLVRRRN